MKVFESETPLVFSIFLQNLKKKKKLPLNLELLRRPDLCIKKGGKLLVFIRQNLRPEAFDPWQSSSR